MSQRPPGHSRLYEQARQLRIRKGLTQREAAAMLGKSQAFVSLLETGGHALADERDYLRLLKARADKPNRIPGGGLIGSRRRKRASDPLRGEPLLPDFDYDSTLPADGSWKIVELVRTSTDSELAFLFDAERLISGLAAFHLIGDTIKRGRIIPIDEEYAINVDLAFNKFFNLDFDLDDLADEDDAAKLDGDDGILADDAPEKNHA